MNKGIAYVVESLKNLRYGFNRFAESISISFLLALSLIVDGETSVDEILMVRFHLTLLAGLLLFTIGKLIVERLDYNEGVWNNTLHKEGNQVPKISKERMIADSAVGVLLVLLFVMIPDEKSTSFLTFYLSLIAVLVAVFIVVPYFPKRPDFSVYTLKTGLKLAQALLYSGVLFIGAGGIVFAVEALFEVNFSDHIYMNVLIVAFVFIGVTFFLSLIDKPDEPVSLSQYPKVIKLLLSYIVIPLMYAYTFIMYAYFIRILVIGEWPVGIVGQLVIWYGITAFATLFLLDGVILNKGWQGFLVKWFPYMFVLPMILLFVAIFIRINHYGVTQLRYYVVSGGIWFVLCILASLFVKKYKSMLFIISGALLLIVGSIGPFSSVQVSFRSQEGRLTELLMEQGYLVDGKLVANNESVPGIEDEIVSILRYLDEIDMVGEVDYLSNNFDPREDSKAVFGFDYYGKYNDRTYYNYRVDRAEGIKVLDDQVLMFSFDRQGVYQMGDVQVSVSDTGFSFDTMDNELFISYDEIGKSLANEDESDDTVSQEQLTIEYELDGMRVLIVFDEIGMELNRGKYVINRGSGLIVIGK